MRRHGREDDGGDDLTWSLLEEDSAPDVGLTNKMLVTAIKKMSPPFFFLSSSVSAIAGSDFEKTKTSLNGI